MAAPATADELVDLLRKCDLVDPEPFESYVAEQRAGGSLPENPSAFAKALIRDGFLTYYQAEQLLSGRWKNFYIGGKYKVLERLGFGGMASVFLCEHRILERLVALKVLPIGGDDPDTLARFHREARAIARLHHPNIVGAYDVDHHGRVHFLVMEYIDGIDLEQYVSGHGPLAPALASQYVRQAAQGLQHAHEAGLVHRDIKPANLLVDRGGTVKVLDLGLARYFHDSSEGLTLKAEEDLILGTLDYLSPEQAIDSHDVDIRADIYSLGATFYFLMTGEGLYPNATPAQKLAALQSRKVRTVRERCPDLPAGLAEILDKMIARDKADRYQSPAEVAEALVPWAQEALAPPMFEGKVRLSPAARSAIKKQSGFLTPGTGAPSGETGVMPAPPSALDLATPTPSPPVVRVKPAAPIRDWSALGRRLALPALAIAAIALLGGFYLLASALTKPKPASRPAASGKPVAGSATRASDPGKQKVGPRRPDRG